MMKRQCSMRYGAAPAWTLRRWCVQFLYEENSKLFCSNRDDLAEIILKQYYWQPLYPKFLITRNTSFFPYHKKWRYNVFSNAITPHSLDYHISSPVKREQLFCRINPARIVALLLSLHKCVRVCLRLAWKRLRNILKIKNRSQNAS